MSNLLTFLRPIPLLGVARVLIVQTGEGSSMADLTERVRGLFGEARIDILLRESDADLRETLDVARVRVARWEERYALLPELRRELYDVVAIRVGGATSELRLLPFLLRTRSIVAFDDQGQARAVTLLRLPAIASHLGIFGAGNSSLGSLRRFAAKVLRMPLVSVAALAVLLVSNGWLRLRGRWRGYR
ncbi:MAG: hypothetical protein VCC00_09600 [Deltaproteobacteria bacterium]